MKKLALVVLSSLLLLNSLLAPVVSLAAPNQPPSSPTSPTTSTSSWYNQNPFDWAAKVYDAKNPSEIFGERYTAAQVQWILYSLIAFPFVTFDSLNPNGPCLLSSISSGVVAMSVCATGVLTGLKDGLSTILSLADSNQSVWASVFNVNNRQLSGIGYIKNQVSRFGIINQVHAQEGFGFGSLGMIRDLWKISRNFAYAIVVLITIVFAFMIMFRVKISPQAVISVQSALPKLFTALILVTFSFAIAGLMVDLMYVFLGFMASLLSTGFNGDFASAYHFLSDNEASGFITIFAYMFAYAVLFIVLVVLNLVSVLATWSVFQAILSILFLLLAVWVVILMFVYTVKIPWVLIKALANIYMSVIIAPLQIIFGAIAPQAGFGTWLKNLISNLLVFPVTGIFFYIAFQFIFKAYIVLGEVILERNIIFDIARLFGMQTPDGYLPGKLWSPPLLGSGAEVSSLIMAIMSFMVIVAIPKATEIVKMLIMGEKFAFGTAIGEAWGPVKSAWGMTGAPIWNTMGKIRSDEYTKDAFIKGNEWLDKQFEKGRKFPRRAADFLGFRKKSDQELNEIFKGH